MVKLFHWSVPASFPPNGDTNTLIWLHQTFHQCFDNTINPNESRPYDRLHHITYSVFDALTTFPHMHDYQSTTPASNTPWPHPCRHQYHLL